MTESAEGIIPREAKKFPFSTKDKYCQILSTNVLPETTETMPSNIYLPSESFGDFSDAITKTTAGGVEYSQTISWFFNHFTKGKLFQGEPTNISLLGATMDVIRAFFGPKALLSFHIHPTKSGELDSFKFSNHDIAGSMGFPRGCYLSLCGSEQGAALLAQTSKAEKLPISNTYSAIRTELKMEDAAFEYKSEQEQAKLLEDLGYAYYIWRPTNGIVKPADFQNGLNFTRIYPQPS